MADHYEEGSSTGGEDDPLYDDEGASEGYSETSDRSSDDSESESESEEYESYEGNPENEGGPKNGAENAMEEEEEDPVEEQAYASPRNSFTTSDQAGPSPGTPNAGNSNEVSTEVEELTPTTSRLASLASGLRQKKRFEESSDGEDSEDSGNGGSSSSHNGFPKPVDLMQEEDNEEPVTRTEETQEEQEKPPASNKAQDQAKPALNKELSTTWMKFEDEAWDSKQDLPPSATKVDPGLYRSKDDSSSHESLEPEKTNGKHISDTVVPASMENEREESVHSEGQKPTVTSSTGLATSPRRVNGVGSVSASANVAFWGDDEPASDEDAVDDAVIGKALETNSPKKAKTKDDLNERTGNQQQQQQGQPGEKGWAGKVIGSALGFVTQKMPFSKDDNDEDIMSEDNVVEPEEEEMPEIHDKPKNVEATGPMQDYSALSVESETRNYINYDDNFARRARDNMVPEESTTTNNEESMTDFSGDPFDRHLIHPSAAMERRHSKEVEAAVESRIKFAKEINHSPTMPLFDLFMDIPHPAAAENPTVAPAVVIGSPSEDESDKDVEEDIRSSIEKITCLAFPEYDGSIAQASDGSASGKQGCDKLMLEAPGFQHYTFTLKLETGSLVYGHVRRYLPTRDDALFRYDVGRRSGRALIIFSRFPGGDDFFAAILK